MNSTSTCSGLGEGEATKQGRQLADPLNHTQHLSSLFSQLWSWAVLRLAGGAPLATGPIAEIRHRTCGARTLWLGSEGAQANSDGKPHAQPR
jgi:hypothetical protein